MGGALERGTQVLGEIPSYGELTVPQELLTERERQLGAGRRLEVALLHLIVVAQYLAVEGDALRQVVETESLREGEPLALPLHVAERLESLIYGE